MNKIMTGSIPLHTLHTHTPYTQHRFKVLTSQRVRSIMHCNDIDSLFRYDFPSVLKLRVPGTPSHEEVKEVSCHGNRKSMTCHQSHCGQSAQKHVPTKYGRVLLEMVQLHSLLE